MPQPLSKVCPKASVSLGPKHSTNKPELAVLVTRIFAVWAWIEHELSVLLLHMLGAEAKPALAMFSVLSSQRLQMSAAWAAAKAALLPNQFKIFAAVVSAIDSVQNDRNRLAHWVWGTCTELPDRLLLANPESLRAREVRKKEYRAEIKNSLQLSIDRFKEVEALDPSEVFVYSKRDLERIVRDLGEAVTMLAIFQIYLDPRYPDGGAPEIVTLGTRAQALDALSGLRLFREALERSKTAQR